MTERLGQDGLQPEDFERLAERERQLIAADAVEGESEDVRRCAWDELHQATAIKTESAAPGQS